MAINCPNIHHPDWKKLVDAVGEPNAYLAFFRAIVDAVGEPNANLAFFRANDIPTVEQAQKILNTPPAPTPPAQPPRPSRNVPGQPGYKYSQTTDTEIAAGIEQVRQIYEVRHQDPILEKAKAALDAVGPDKLAAAILAGKDTMHPDDREAMNQMVKNAWQKQLDETEDTKQAAELTRKIQRLSTEYHPDVRGWAQGMAMRAQWVDTPAGAQENFVNQTHQNQDAQMGGGKQFDDALKQAQDALREINEKAIAKNTDEINKALQRPTPTKPVWAQYKDEAVEKIFDLLDGGDIPPEKAPLQEFTSRLVSEVKQKMREGGIVPEKAPGSPPPKPSDVLREMMANKEKYAEVVKQFRDEYAKNASPEALEAIDDALAEMDFRKPSKRLFDKVSKEIHEGVSTKRRDLVKEHFTKVNRIHRDLAEALVSEGGMTEADARQVASQLTEHLNEQTAGDKRKALERLKNQPTATGPQKKAWSAVQKAVELSNMGAMDQADMRDVVAKKLNLPQVTPDQMKNIGKLAEAIETAPNEMMKARAQIELAQALKIYKGIGPVEYMTSMMAAKWLSGPGTGGVVLTGNLVSNLANTAALIGTNPMEAPQAVMAFLSGFQRAWDDSRQIIKKGEGLKDFGENAQIIPRILGEVKADQVFPKWVPGKKLIDLNGEVFKYVGRGMRVAHAAFYHSSKNVYDTVMVNRLLKAEYRGQALKDKVREVLNTSPADFLSAKTQAEKEGWKDLDLSVRVQQIMMDRRAKSLSALGPGGEGIKEGSERFAMTAALLNKPEGIAGIINYHLQEAVKEAKLGKVPLLKPFFMFTNVMTNMTNMGLDWSPFGFADAWSGKTRIPGTGEYRQYSSEETNRRYFAAVAGSLMLGAALVAALNQPDDPKKRWFDITGPGPKNPHLQDQLKAAGVMPWSIKIGEGNNYHFYGHSGPLIIALGVAGMVADEIRHGKNDESEMALRIAVALANTPTAITNLPTLQVMMGFLNDLHYGMTAKNAEYLATRIVTGAEPFTPVGSAFLNFLDRLSDESPVRLNPLGRPSLSQIPGIRRLGKTKVDRLGEPIKSSPFDRISKSMTDDPVRLLLIKNNIAIGNPHERAKIFTPSEPKGRGMTETEKNEYNRISGQAIHKRLSDSLAELNGMTPEQLTKEVEAVTNEESETAVQIIQDRATAQQPKKKSFFNPFNQ